MLPGIVMVVVLFYVLPVILTVALPAWVIPHLAARVLNRKKEKIPSLWPFILNLILLAIAANIFWEMAIFDHVYHEWDRTIAPYSFFSMNHLASVMDQTGSLPDGNCGTWM